MYAIIPRAARTTPILCLAARDYAAWLKKQPAAARNMLDGFKPEPGAHRALTGRDGRTESIIVVTHDRPEIWDLAALPLALAAGDYGLDLRHIEEQGSAATLWALG